ncbi:MAG TPA: SRPBCC domain-containing protein [Burkholderiales bacterium]|jgi:uncharacterized protein YndB with AHSA1/START domain|nr:SRPBCC domain-containing protein [Burkholderiales bacterium]
MTPFVISRVFDAPRERVWKAWTDAAELKQWWGPRGFKVKSCKVDLRPGGMFLYGMTAPDGTDTWGKFVYREIVAPTKLVCIVSFSDAQGGVTRHPWSPGWPLYWHSTVEFEEQGTARTKVTVTWLPQEASDAERGTFEEGRDSMNQGWGGTLDQLAGHLEKR